MAKDIQHPHLTIDEVFLLHAEFTHRADVLSIPVKPANVGPMSIDVRAGASPDSSQGFMQVTVSTDDSKSPVYHISATMAAVVSSPDGVVEDFLRTSVLAMLYPFLREVVANLTARGRFGPVWLQPIDPRQPLDVVRPGEVTSKQVTSGKKSPRKRSASTK